MSAACACADTMAPLLAEHNLGLDIPLQYDPMTGKCLVTQTLVAVYKLDRSKRQKPPLVFASYCPFCGTRYDPLPSNGEGGEAIR